MWKRITIAAALAAVFRAQEVLVLTEKNIEETLKEHANGILVEFYAPWCGHCKALEPEYNAAAKKLHADGVKTPLAKVDATVESKLGSKYGVQGYPTLKYFVGGEPSDYDGPRKTDGIVAWIKGVSGPAVVEGAPKEDDPLSATWLGESESEDFAALAKTNRKKAAWYWNKEGKADKLVMKHKGEPALECSDCKDKAAMEKFFKENAFPKFGQLNGDTFANYIDRGAGMVWVLLKMDKDTAEKVVEEARPGMTKLAEAKKTFSVTWTNTNEFGKVLENMFGITEFPKVVVQKKAGDKKSFIYDGEITGEKVEQYITDIEDGKIKPHLKTEPAPEEPQEDPVKVVTGSNMEKLVFDDEKDVLLEIYAPWCGHCKKLEPEYLKVGKKVQKEGLEDIMTIAKMDGTANDSPIDEITYSGFPTLYYVKAGTKKPESFDGGRDAKAIWKWIKKNHSKADKIAEKLAANKGDKETKKEEL